jgi:PAS domain S-box-containing protein
MHAGYDGMGWPQGTTQESRMPPLQRHYLRKRNAVQLPDTTPLENIREVAWIKDADGRFVAVNGAFVAEFHVAQAEVAGKTDYYIFPVRLAERLQASDRDVLHAGRTTRIVHCISRNEISKRVEMVKSPIIDAAGAILGTLTVMRDLTAQ